MIPPGWTLATHPDDGEQVAHKRYDGHARLDILSWVAASAQALDEGADEFATTKAQVDRECTAMAERLMSWPSREPMTYQQLLELNGTDPERWRWLNGLCYPPLQDGEERLAETVKKNCEPLLRWQVGILRLYRELAEIASDSSTRSGDRKTVHSVDLYVPTAEAPLSLETTSSSIPGSAS